jgi:hypothetical protein
VERHGVGKWSEAVMRLPGHTHQQALHRWRKVRFTAGTLNLQTLHFKP